MKKAIFEGLVFGPNSQPLKTGWVGGEPCYIFDDDGFLRHIPAVDIDLQVWDILTKGIEGNEDMLSEQAAKMLGQDDIFSIAVIRSQLENKEKQFETLQNSGFPEDSRMYLGMIGFKVIVDYHGEVVEVIQPHVPMQEGDE